MYIYLLHTINTKCQIQFLRAEFGLQTDVQIERRKQLLPPAYYNEPSTPFIKYRKPYDFW